MKALIFDMDGVIFDSESIWEKAFKVANEKFSLSLTEKDRQDCCGKEENQIRQELKAKYQFDVDQYRDFIIDYVNDKINSHGAQLKEGFNQLCYYCKDNNIKMALATSSKKDRALNLFKKAKMNAEEIFDFMVFSEDVKMGKPNPEIFIKASEGVGEKPSDCIVLEDSINGVVAAKNGGFNCIMVIDRIPPDETCKDFTMIVLDSLNDVKEFIANL